MRDHLRAHTLEDDRAERVIGMMMCEDEPPDRQLVIVRIVRSSVFPLRGARERIDHHHTRARHDESRVGAPLRSLSGVAEYCVRARAELANGIGADRVRPLAWLPASQRGCRRRNPP